MERGIRAFSHLQTRERNEPGGPLCYLISFAFPFSIMKEKCNRGLIVFVWVKFSFRRLAAGSVPPRNSLSPRPR